MQERRPVAIVGAGTMGSQIALQLAAYGTAVVLADRSAEALQRAVERIRRESVQAVAAGHLPEAARSAAERVRLAESLADAVGDAWLVIEAIPERVDVKRAFYAEISRLVPPDTLLATNSSSFKSRLMADVTLHPERLMNAHFYNVPWQRSGVELMTCGQTDPAAIERVAEFLRGRGLYPVVVRGESTGFIYNRIWRAIKKESLKVVAAGLATPEEVDRLACLSLGATVGPFALMDLVGLDVVLDIERHYAAESGDPSDEPPAMLVEMVERGQLGKKTGEGFYRYPGAAWEQAGWPRT